MNSHILPMGGVECGKCFRPASYHDFRTGITHHVSPYTPNCQVHPPRPVPTPVGGD